MRTGGAAKLVKVPPMETLTKSTPSVPNSNAFERWCRYTKSRNKNAANVMAAGSVIRDPNNGVIDSVKKYKEGALLMRKMSWSPLASRYKTSVEINRIGLLPATIMMAKTNRGSVKLRFAKKALAVSKSSIKQMKMIRTAAQKPKTISTSPRRCQRPEWALEFLARVSK